MFPICSKCGCETLDESCGAWTPAFVHNCLEALQNEETAVLRMLHSVQERIEEARRAKTNR